MQGTVMCAGLTLTCWLAGGSAREGATHGSYTKKAGIASRAVPSGTVKLSSFYLFPLSASGCWKPLKDEYVVVALSSQSAVSAATAAH